MDEIIQIGVFIAIMVAAVVQQNAKSKRKPSTASPAEVLEDLFPELKQEKETTVEPPTVAERPVVRTRKSASSRTQPQTSKTAPVSKGTASSDGQGKKIRLSNREEARRAFIYSEIFNRKY